MIKINPNAKQMGTHMPVLLKLIPQTTGDVCELGAGLYSTPLLHWLCQGRKLVSYENDPEYLHYAKKFQSHNHRIREMDQLDLKRHWGVVFIDHHATKKCCKRGDMALKFENADIIVLHDTEPNSRDEYHYEQVFPLFKYRYDWKECLPHTSVLSNKIDVCQLFQS